MYPSTPDTQRHDLTPADLLGMRVESGAGAAIPWYLSGGISAANCLAAYTPKGAASLAASYDNNAAPGNGLPDGTYDATPGVAPTWDAVNGWTFTTSTWLNSGVVPSAGWSYIIKFVGATTNNGYLFGSIVGTGLDVRITPQRGLVAVWYGNGNGILQVLPALQTGTLGMAGQTAYRNGSPEVGAIPAPTGVTVAPIHINGYNIGSGNLGRADADVSSFAIYNITITAAQVAAVHAAMP